MSQNAVLTQGTILQRGDGGTPEVFTQVPEVTAITGPAATKAEIDVSDLSSTAKEFKGGLADWGRMTVEMHYIPGNAIHGQLRADFANTLSPVHNFKLLFVNGHQWAFTAYVSGFPGTTAADSVQKASLDLRMTGPVVET